MTIDLCHLFVFVADRAAAEQAFAACGLVPSFARSHPGQGTANLCACFDNAYLELLWCEDENELASAPVVRTRLAERARWRETGASPFGIGLRGHLPFPSWEYRPLYLPEGMSIPVALASEDPRQPFIFRSPGSVRPDAWTDDQAGARQQAAGMTEIGGLQLELPVAAAPALKCLAEKRFLTLKPAVRPRLDVAITVTGGGQRRLTLPQFLLE
jgi:hypothetical protein